MSEHDENHWKENFNFICIRFDYPLSVSFMQPEWKIFSNRSADWIQKDNNWVAYIFHSLLQVFFNFNKYGNKPLLHWILE